MITLTNVAKSFGARVLFRGVGLQVNARDRIAIVGPNGSGKSTLFDMVVGEQEPDEGEIRVARDAVLGYLRQETDAMRGRSIIEEVLSVQSEATKTGHRLALLEAEIAEMAPGRERERLVSEYGHLQDRFATLGGYSVEQQARRVLAGLGFREEQMEQPTDTLSGGWLMRISLAKLLVAGPDVLMLDEPTNHLDVESVEWLERYLRVYEGAILLISHDRDFINGIATKVAEIHDRTLISYTGDYAAFVRQREQTMLQLEAAAKQQARELAKTQLFINRFRYKDSKAKQVQSRIKALEKMQRVETRTVPRRAMKLSFPPPPRSGRDVVTLSNVTFAYDRVPVYDDLELVIERSQKVALVGPNGAGKSTLLKLLAGTLEPQRGNRKLGHNVSLGYFAQHQIEALDTSKRVIEELERAMPPDADIKPRNLLGRFLFSGEDVDKRVAVLSGGERTRLALAKLLVSPLNVLCLDEPTNHLDIQGRDVVEDALADYQGAVVLITHDRHLIRSVADRIIEIVDGRVTIFGGDYDYYLTKRTRETNDREPPPKATSTETAKDRRRRSATERAKTKGLRDRIATIEAELERALSELSRLQAVMADPAVYSSDTDVGALVREYERWQRKTRQLENDWEEATTSLEAAQERSVR